MSCETLGVSTDICVSDNEDDDDDDNGTCFDDVVSESVADRKTL